MATKTPDEGRRFPSGWRLIVLQGETESVTTREISVAASEKILYFIQ
jgi:hypothetical protein